MQSTTTEKVIDRLADTFCRYGLPVTIKSDNGPQFKSIEFKEYCEQHGITHHKVTAKWAQANGGGGEAESVITEAAADCSGRK